MDVSDDMQQQAKALADPSRFRLFRHIVESDRPVGVAELTELLGFNHNAIRQHLAVLRDAGLVVESDEDRKVRGRPRKEYAAREDALNAFRSISGSYEQLARLLLEMLTSGRDPYTVGFDAISPDGAARTPSSGGVVAALTRQLAIAGFEPSLHTDADNSARKSGSAARSVVTLHHCPFADVAAIDPHIVCELHRGLINGALHQQEPGLTAALEPRPPATAGCTVTVQLTPPATD